jgi:hypothetical protein
VSPGPSPGGGGGAGSTGGHTRLARFALRTAVLALGGCGGGMEMMVPPAPLEVAVGGAAPNGSGFLPLAGDVSLVPGAQGGFHVWMKFRVSGGAPGITSIAYSVRRISDGRLILNAGGRDLEIGPPGEAGYWEVPGALPAFMCPSPLGVQVQDQPMRLRLEIGSPDTAAEAEFTPRCPEGDQASFCAQICSG